MAGSSSFAVLLELGKSKEVISVDASSLEAAIKSRLPSSSSSDALKLLPFDSCPREKGTFILQKWDERWQCYVDAGKDIQEGDKLTVVECDGFEVKTNRSFHY